MKRYIGLLPLILTIMINMNIKSQTTMTTQSEEQQPIKQQLIIKSIASIDNLDAQPSHYIGCANWEKFPLNPGASFKIARLADMLVIRFTVNESSPRAVNDSDFDPVWEDSCVEFFCQEPGHKEYYNFEFNSKGVGVASSRTGQKENINLFSEEKMKSILRKVDIEADRWSIEITIPISHIVENAAYPLRLKGNFYKCGDKCRIPHFLSWSPIYNPTPLFHCPQFFGNIVIE